MAYNIYNNYKGSSPIAHFNKAQNILPEEKNEEDDL